MRRAAILCIFNWNKVQCILWGLLTGKQAQECSLCIHANFNPSGDFEQMLAQVSRKWNGGDIVKTENKHDWYIDGPKTYFVSIQQTKSFKIHRMILRADWARLFSSMPTSAVGPLSILMAQNGICVALMGPHSYKNTGISWTQVAVTAAKTL